MEYTNSFLPAVVGRIKGWYAVLMERDRLASKMERLLKGWQAGAKKAPRVGCWPKNGKMAGGTKARPVRRMEGQDTGKKGTCWKEIELIYLCRTGWKAGVMTERMKG